MKNMPSQFIRIARVINDIGGTFTLFMEIVGDHSTSPYYKVTLTPKEMYDLKRLLGVSTLSPAGGAVFVNNAIPNNIGAAFEQLLNGAKKVWISFVEPVPQGSSLASARGYKLTVSLRPSNYYAQRSVWRSVLDDALDVLTRCVGLYKSGTVYVTSARMDELTMRLGIKSAMLCEGQYFILPQDRRFWNPKAALDSVW